MTWPQAEGKPPEVPAPLRRPRIWEVTALTVLCIGVIVDALTIPWSGDPLGSRYAALALFLGGVALARRHPWPGLVLIAGSPVLAAALDAEPLPYWSFVVFAAFLVALRGLPGLPVGLLTGLGNYTALSLAMGTGGWSQLGSIAAALCLAAAAAGSAIRQHSRYWDELCRRARDAVVTREAVAERRVAEERLRIARDLHDGMGHEIAVINMHLGAAEVHLPAGAQGDAARTDLAAARAGVQGVLRETQNLLGALRLGGDGTPVADYRGIPALIESARAAGLAVDAEIAPVPEGLPLTVGAAAYRIMQEALTNARRHGSGGVSVRVGQTDGVVIVETVNVRAESEGRQSQAGSGFGLVGMRERAESVGGSLQAAAEGRLFKLRAVLGPSPQDGGDEQGVPNPGRGPAGEEAQ
ncbi:MULTISPECIES: sensor histidine kinase [unclassified Streptomyces]|uniref:sensor histidine kinase n=1 Tax=unclassified Streptomyces TaxID=2593676 RepID=UPI0036EBDCDF